ncbi:helix-turn-helix transcriptional regulator [Lacisediminihabitans changchengi]|uniref:WYL domain-containing protein n=1 Tax=Lacisediminihabitans changchengi TaxID=2787634 RepID=A0A934SKI0_9MICO|nr:WYL domain-containing protein [Lacisediminihabitans changchengi]MBK4347034.1 WYL domain-containing protein [Lacisediminihabitans changchengi]MBK4347843.1 WYL domain-containing protein [Lacisediminihabitans changchengi]
MADRAVPLQAQDKLAFLLSLVPFLMEHERISVQETANHFGVTPMAVREAVELIAVSGIPGETGQYQHGDLFDLAWDDFEENDQIVLTNLVAIDDAPRFSGREAAALIAGLQYLSALPENADRSAIASLMTKLSHGASALPSQVAVEGSESDATLALIRESVAAGVQIEFDYLNSRGEHERRRVDPLRIESVDADWYLRGWCHLRTAVRTFRIDRISDPLVTAEPITFHAGEVALPDTLFEGTADDLPVTIEILPSALPLVADYIPDGTPTVEVDGRLRANILVSHYHGLKRLIAGLPGMVTVIAPGEARSVVADWAAAGAARYTDDPA